MTLGLIGEKLGMTRIFQEDGVSVPVTVIRCSPNRVTQVKTMKADGYVAVQVTMGEKKRSRVNKALAGHYAKAGVEAGTVLHEFRVDGEVSLNIGDTLETSLFEDTAYVDVTGTSIGKGFAGVIKRHNFSMQDATHGNSVSHRAPGSIGQCQYPGRVFKGKKMAGHMGAVQRTTQSLSVVRIDAENHLIMVKGSVPGSKGNRVVIKPAIKK